MNHCIHGTELDGYCPACALDMLNIEDWLGCTLSHDVQSFSALLADCATA